MSRRIQQGDFRVSCSEAGLLGENGNAPGPLQAVGIQKRVPVIHAPQTFEPSGAVQHGFREGGLSGVDVGQNAGD